MFNPCVVFLLSAPTSSEKPNMQNGSCFRAVTRRHFLKRPYRYLQFSAAYPCAAYLWPEATANRVRLRRMHSACRRVCTCNLGPIFRQQLRRPLGAYSLIFSFHFARVNLAGLWLQSVRCSPRPKESGSAPPFSALHMICLQKKLQKKTHFGCQIPAPKLGPCFGPLIKMNTK